MVHATGDAPTPSRWWALAALIPLTLFVLVGVVATSGDLDASFISRLYFAGDPDRWAFITADVRADPSVLDDARLALFVDLAFATSFAVVGYLLLRTGHRHWAPLRRSPDRGGRRLWPQMAAIAVVAGVLDLVETAGQLVWLDDASPPTVATHVIAAIAWWKWLAYLVALVGLFGLVIGPILGLRLRSLLVRVFGEEPLPSPPDRALQPPDQPGVHRVERQQPEEILGITASGGGIRSASVMIGAFRGLCAAGTFQRARWLHAVSGGGYASGGWQASSQSGDLDLFGADHPWFRSVRHRLRYLDNGRGSILVAVIGVIVRSVIVLGSVVAAAVLAGFEAATACRF